MNIDELSSKEKNLASLKDVTLKSLEKLGFDAVPKPVKSLSVPLDITKLADRDLGKLFQRAIAWENYAGDQLAYSRIEEMLAQYSYDLLIAKAMKKLTGGVQQRKAQANTVQSVRKAKLFLLRCSSQVIAFESQFSRFTRTAQALSREQTRREKLLRGD